jgi:hypothetical protein
MHNRLDDKVPDFLLNPACSRLHERNPGRFSVSGYTDARRQRLGPQSAFLRINRSYIINREQIDSFDNNDVFIKSYEIAIGNSFRDSFFEELMEKS